MVKIAFIGNSEPPDRLLAIFKKMTPNSSGIWGQIEGVDAYDKADYYVVIDYLPSDLKKVIPEEKCIFLGAHPETMCAYHSQVKYKGFRNIDIAYQAGFCEWWINLDYTYLSNLQPMIKTKQLASIMSDANSQFYHKARRDHLERFVNDNAHKVEFNLHGRVVPYTEKMKQYYRGVCGSYNPSGGENDHMSGKEKVLAEHKYILEYDCTGEHYISERVFDDLLMWCLPIYWGGKGAEKYLPKESVFQLDIKGNGSDFVDLLNGDLYERSLPAIAQARNILLNELQLWPTIHKAIFGVYNV